MYFLGIALISFSVILSFRTGFGATPADNLTGIISKTTHISLGTAAFLVSTFFIIVLILYYKNFKFLFLFVQVIVFSPMLDFWDLVILKDYMPLGAMTWIVFAASVFILPFGGMLMIKSTYPAGLYDELMFLTYRHTKLKLGVSRTFNEMAIVLIAVSISLLTKNGFGTVYYGTIVYALSIGYLLKFYIFGFEKLNHKRRNIYGTK